MPDLNKDPQTLIQMLKPLVTGFSLEIQLNNKHEDEITCGGRIISILDMSLISDDPSSQIVYVKLDDGIGETLVLVPVLEWRKYSPQLGDIILAEGQLYKVLKETVFKTKTGSTYTVTDNSEPLRLLTRSIKIVKSKSK